MPPLASRAISIDRGSRGLALACLVTLGLVISVRAQTVTSFGAGQWGAADATLGVSGFVIEDFEDTTLVAGLKIGWNTPGGNVTPATTIPATFNPATDDSFGGAFQSGNWDGSNGLLNTRTNDTFNYFDTTAWGNIILEFTTGVSSVGFSLDQMQQEATLWVNGSSLGNVTTLTGFSTSAGRLGYLRIDAGGSPITSLEFRNSTGDGVLIDHLAFAPIPEPGAYALLGGCAVLAFALRRAQRRVKPSSPAPSG